MIKIQVLLTLFILAPSALAGITCETPRGAKVLEIKERSVSVQHPFKVAAQRAVASSSNVRTKIQGDGYTKVLFHQGEKHIIHIEDKNSFSELDDYLIIRSKEGHEMTYPLHCKS